MEGAAAVETVQETVKIGETCSRRFIGMDGIGNCYHINLNCFLQCVPKTTPRLGQFRKINISSSFHKMRRWIINLLYTTKYLSWTLLLS